jgi:hypothetical protein
MKDVVKHSFKTYFTLRIPLYGHLIRITGGIFKGAMDVIDYLLMLIEGGPEPCNEQEPYGIKRMKTLSPGLHSPL